MKTCDSVLLYVLSGTGNTYRVACWLIEFLQSKHIKTFQQYIEQVSVQADIERPERQLLAILFPTHGFMPPWSMIKFLLRLPRQKKSPAIIIATRGAYCLGPLTIPGAAGFATFFAAGILFFKGYDIRGFISLDMAANMNNFHPSLSKASVKRIANKSHARAAGFFAKILFGRRVILTLNNVYEAIWSILLFTVIPIFPILYLLYGKTAMAKIMFANNSCISCGRCALFCPNKAIEMKKFLGKVRPFWTFHCENCMRCMGFCKKRAVEAGHSLAILQYFIASIPVVALIISKSTFALGYSFEITSYWTMLLLEIGYFLPVLFLSYWIFWLLIRIPIIHNFFTITTLTHYFKRYHEPDTRLGDLRKKGRQ